MKEIMFLLSFFTPSNSVFRCWQQGILALFSLCLSAPLAAELAAAKFIFVHPDVAIIRAEVAQQAAKDMELLGHDTIRTGQQGYAQLQFSDGNRLVVRGETELRLDEYHFDSAQNAANRLELSLQKGAIRSVSGKIAQQQPHNYLIKTAVGIIGVRGTDHESRYIPQPAPGEPAPIAKPGLYDRVHSGATVLTNALGSVVVGPDQAGFISSDMGGAIPVVLPEIPAFYAQGTPPPDHTTTDQPHEMKEKPQSNQGNSATTKPAAGARPEHENRRKAIEAEEKVPLPTRPQLEQNTPENYLHQRPLLPEAPKTQDIPLASGTPLRADDFLSHTAEANWQEEIAHIPLVEALPLPTLPAAPAPLPPSLTPQTPLEPLPPPTTTAPKTEPPIADPTPVDPVSPPNTVVPKTETLVADPTPVEPVSPGTVPPKTEVPGDTNHSGEMATSPSIPPATTVPDKTTTPQTSVEPASNPSVAQPAAEVTVSTPERTDTVIISLPGVATLPETPSTPPDAHTVPIPAGTFPQ